jgi:hypothetical protein
MKRITNTRRLTPAEAARNRRIIRLVEKEFPPLPSPAQRKILRWLVAHSDASLRLVTYRGGGFFPAAYCRCVRPTSWTESVPGPRLPSFQAMCRLGWLKKQGHESRGGMRGINTEGSWYTVHQHWVISAKGRKVLEQADEQSAH